MSKSIETIIEDGYYDLAITMVKLVDLPGGVTKEDIIRYTEWLIDKDILKKRKQKLEKIINTL